MVSCWTETLSTQRVIAVTPSQDNMTVVIQCVWKVAVHLYKVLEVMSTHDSE
jgi:hypothetical protein